MEKSFEGRIWKLGDDIDTDIIMPTQWVTLDTMDEVKKHAFEPLRPELAAAIQPGTSSSPATILAAVPPANRPRKH